MLAACSWAVGDTASDERELTQLVNDLNAAIVKPDIAFLERVLAKDYVHYRPHGNVETRAQYLEDRVLLVTSRHALDTASGGAADGQLARSGSVDFCRRG